MSLTPEESERLSRIERKIDEMDIKFTAVLTMVDEISNQAKPAIEALVNSPLVKMITGGK